MTPVAQCYRLLSFLVIRWQESGENIYSVKDNGVGFDTRAGNRVGLGLLGMTERVRKLGGTLEVVSQAGQGSSILAKMPLKEVTAAHEENSSVVGG